MDKITVWDLPDTKIERDGYDDKTVPDISAKNIHVLMNKINELVDRVNFLEDWLISRSNEAPK